MSKVNSSTDVKQAKESKKQVRIVFGKEIPKDWRKEIRVLLRAIQSFEGQTSVTFSQVFNKAKELRNNSEFDLKPFADLSKKVQTNFENRLAKTLGGSEETATLRPSAQAKFFNFEIQTGKQIKFSEPIDPTALISPQVKTRTFDLSRISVASLKQPKKEYKELSRTRKAKLDAFLGRS